MHHMVLPQTVFYMPSMPRLSFLQVMVEILHSCVAFTIFYDVLAYANNVCFLLKSVAEQVLKGNIFKCKH